MSRHGVHVSKMTLWGDEPHEVIILDQNLILVRAASIKNEEAYYVVDFTTEACSCRLMPDMKLARKCKHLAIARAAWEYQTTSQSLDQMEAKYG